MGEGLDGICNNITSGSRCDASACDVLNANVDYVLANDVLKAISCVGEPALNFFFFDAASLVGTLDRVACPE